MGSGGIGVLGQDQENVCQETVWEMTFRQAAINARVIVIMIVGVKK